MPVPTADPARWDFSAVIGDTLQPASFVLDDGATPAVPYDLTGVTGECQIRSEPGGALILAPTVTITDAAEGEFTFASSAAATADLAPGRARYAVRLTWPSGEVRTVIEGVVTIRSGVVS